ncbi:GntR family transcriptional regulator [Virgibacillus halophilus]|uniref:GntR family transcriptional regulator n=1 Tax=Tigheibacillus halophilus TaxID=361280 RepID=A0ABU5C5M4_9BACI|nr:GntR family transcriptional regulator [Virgibacillus halophilus]
MDKTSRVPRYLQLMEELIKQIQDGKYQVHDKLPSERELCDLYELSRITVRQALQELEREGYIYKEHGKGTFVASKTYDQDLVKLYSFTEAMKEQGRQPSTKVLSFRELEIDEHLAKQMKLKPKEEVFQVIRLRLADEEPLMYETSYLPKRIFRHLTASDLVERPMYDVFQADYHVFVTKAVEQFSATLVRSDEAEHLNVANNNPAMLVRRYAYHHDTLIEYTVSVARGDKFHYTVELD